MPITQERVIAIIEAGTKFETALELASRMLQTAQDRVQAGGNAEAELLQLSSMIRPDLMISNYGQTIAALAIERNHFQRTKKSNEWRKRYQADRRAGRETKKFREIPRVPVQRVQTSQQASPPLIQQSSENSPISTLPLKYADEDESESMKDGDGGALFPSEGEAGSGEDEINIDGINLDFDPSRVSPDLMVEVEQALREQRVRRGEPAIQPPTSPQSQEENKS